MATLPPARELIQSIRSSCASSTSRAAITINPDAVDRFILSVDEKNWQATAGADAHGVRLPLRFDSAEDELNLLSTLALLNFLSGYRLALHRLTGGRGAYSFILSLVLSAYLSSNSIGSDEPASILTAAGMRAATPASLAGLARIKTHVEKPHPTLGPAVTVGEKDDEAWEVLELLVGVLNQTGEVLKLLGKDSLGEWIAGELRRTGGDVGEMVHSLASTFPAFNDSHLDGKDGQPVYLFKKALWLLTVVALRFEKAGEEGEKPTFPLPKVKEANLPVFADNVLPSLLIHHSILTLSSSTDPALSSLSLSAPSTTTSSSSSSSSSSSHSPPLLPRPSATRLRAAAVTACAAIVSRAHELAAEGGGEEKKWLKEWTEQRLDAYLWGLGKKEEGKEVARIAETGTVFY
ncbi:hypothetical protein JCM6882_003899 [Rhodosporidiobolus microsporus]